LARLLVAAAVAVAVLTDVPVGGVEVVVGEPEDAARRPLVKLSARCLPTKEIYSISFMMFFFFIGFAFGSAAE
jgi:hypothetical protein